MKKQINDYNINKNMQALIGDLNKDPILNVKDLPPSTSGVIPTSLCTLLVGILVVMLFLDTDKKDRLA